jgi:hypothetical protein
MHCKPSCNHCTMQQQLPDAGDVHTMMLCKSLHSCAMYKAFIMLFEHGVILVIDVLSTLTCLLHVKPAAYCRFLLIATQSISAVSVGPALSMPTHAYVFPEEQPGCMVYSQHTQTPADHPFHLVCEASVPVHTPACSSRPFAPSLLSDQSSLPNTCMLVIVCNSS